MMKINTRYKLQLYLRYYLVKLKLVRPRSYVRSINKLMSIIRISSFYLNPENLDSKKPAIVSTKRFCEGYSLKNNIFYIHQQNLDDD